MKNSSRYQSIKILFVVLTFCWGLSQAKSSHMALQVTKTVGAVDTIKPITVADLGSVLEPSEKITYKTIGKVQLQLHIFRPVQSGKSGKVTPAFVIFHGGGWMGGEPRVGYPFAKHYADRGWTGISVQYRLITKANHLSAVDCDKDARSAIRYIRAHAKQLGINSKEIIAAGLSAGGQLAAATALFDGMDDESDDLKISPIPQALVLYYSVVDTSPEGYGHEKAGPDWQQTSPLYRVKSGMPPVILFHGSKDNTAPYKGAVDFRSAVLNAGSRCELVTFDGGGHSYFMKDNRLFNDVMLKTDLFLKSLGFPLGQ